MISEKPSSSFPLLDGARELADAAMLRILASYAPPPYLRFLSETPQPETAVRLPVHAAVLFADVSGFTRLTERLCREGEVGVELLASTLNAYFGHVIDVITGLGGEVVKFAGDGLIAIWAQPAYEALTREQAERCAEQAARCALSLQRGLRDVSPVQVHGITMSMRIGIGLGAASLRQLGGQGGRWELAFSGPVVQQASLACPRAEPGEVVLSPSVCSRLAARAVIAPLPDGYARLLDLADQETAPVLAKPVLFAAMIPALRACLPEVVLGRLDAGQSGWLTELRRVTVLFVKLPELDSAERSGERSGDAVPALLRALQAVIGRYEGDINKLHVDEKGAMLLAVFGLPPLSHPDDALRGVRAALLCQRVLAEHGERCAIGISTGHAFCGTIGNDTRREYTVLGDVVNLAARLMSAAAERGETHPILCDSITHEAARAGIEFGAPVMLSIKGKATPISTCTPRGEVSGNETTTPPERLGTRMQGRTEEMQRLTARLRAQLSQSGGLVIIEGEAGIGKSCLSGQLLAQARQLGIDILYGGGDAIERSTAYFAWTRIFREIFGLPIDGSEADARKVREKILELLPEQAVHSGQAELLGPVLRLRREASHDEGDGWAAVMASRGAAEQRQSLLIQILTRLHERSPTLLLIENTHWLDSASWALLGRVRRELPKLLIAVVSRPPAAIDDPMAQAEYQKLRADPDCELLQLSPLSLEHTAALLRERLAITGLPQLLVDFIFGQTHGHPFFATELASALRDAGALHIEDGTCRLTQTPDALRAQRFPTTMSGVVLSRIDRLRPQQLLLLKVASVIGYTFLYRIVDGIHPIPADRPHLPGYLDDLEQHELTVRQAAIELTYSFRHSIIQDVAYNTLSFAQRRQLHLAIAEWYERVEASAKQPTQGLLHVERLAHHYSQAAEHPHATQEELSKAIEALRRAGEQALRSGATRESIGLYERALGLLTRLPETEARRRIELSLRVPQSLGLGVVRGYAAVETEQALLRCLAQCQRAAEEPHELLPTLFGLWSFSILRGKLWRARDYASQIFRYGSVDPESDASVAGELVQQVTCFYLGELLTSRQHGEVLLRRYQLGRHQHLTYMLNVDPEIMSLVHHGHAQWLLGNDGPARACYHGAFERSREVGHPYSTGFAIYSLCTYYQTYGDIPAVRRHTEALAALADKHGYGHSKLQSDFMRGWLLVQDGSSTEGFALMQRTIAARRASGAELTLCLLLAIYARSLLEAGQIDTAHAMTRESLALIEENGERLFASIVLLIHAEVLIRKRSSSVLDPSIDAEPEDILNRAIEIARSQGSAFQELRAVMVLCRLWMAQGKTEGARVLLAQTLQQQRGSLHPREHQTAQDLLKELSP